MLFSFKFFLSIKLPSLGIATVLLNKFKSDKIPTAIFYRKIFSKSIILKKDNNNRIFLNSENDSSKIFSIPMHPYIYEKDLNIIIENIIDFFKN